MHKCGRPDIFQRRHFEDEDCETCVDMGPELAAGSYDGWGNPARRYCKEKRLT
jgi:hypothetical protein